MKSTSLLPPSSVKFSSDIRMVIMFPTSSKISLRVESRHIRTSLLILPRYTVRFATVSISANIHLITSYMNPASLRLSIRNYSIASSRDLLLIGIMALGVLHLFRSYLLERLFVASVDFLIAASLAPENPALFIDTTSATVVNLANQCAIVLFCARIGLSSTF